MQHIYLEPQQGKTCKIIQQAVSEYKGAQKLDCELFCVFF